MVVTVPAQVNPGTTVLLETPGQYPSADEESLQLIAGAEPSRRHVVAVAVTGSGEALVDAWAGRVSGTPADLTVVDVGGRDRSASVQRAESSPSTNVINTVEHAWDMKTIRSHVEAGIGEPVPDGETRFLYVDSIGSLVEAAGLRATITLLDEVRSLVRRTGSFAFVRADRSAIDRHVAAVLADLVDVTLALDPRDDGPLLSVPTTETGGDAGHGSAAGLSTDELFQLLSNRHRRLVLQSLLETRQPVTVAALAREVVDSVEMAGDEAFERVYTGLVHVHLPMLESHGVVSVDADREAIRLETADRLGPLLALTATGDLLG